MTFYDHSKSIAFTIHQVVFLLDKLADKTLQQKLNLTHSQFLILMALNYNPDVSQAKIAQYLELTEAAVSRQIEILIEKKMIAGQENKNNRRENILSLTKSGQDKLHEAFHVLDNKYQEIFKVIGKSDSKTFSQSLDKLLNALCSDKDLHCDPKKKGQYE